MVRILFALVLALASVAVADEKPLGPALVEVKTVAEDKLEVKFDKWNEPQKIGSADELKKFVSDEATRTRLTKQFDLKTHDLLVFAWQGSGQDRLGYTILESFPEQVPFTLKLGATDDLRKHIRLIAVRKNVRWTAK